MSADAGTSDAMPTLRSNDPQHGRAPEFRARQRTKLVPSFRYATWRGIQAGLIGVDSSNVCSFVVRVRGAFSSQVLTAAFEALVCRHDALRAVVREVDLRPHLWYGDECRAELERHDLTPLASDVRHAEATQLASEAVWRRFDATVGPLYRGFLIDLGATDYVFGMVIHHFVADAVSTSVLLQEFFALCCIEAKRPNAYLKPPTLQFSDYLLCLSEWFASSAGIRQTDYWRKRLTGSPPIILPFPEPGAHATPAQREYFDISGELRSAVEMLARSMNTTPFVVLLSAQKILLERLTGEEDVTIGAVTSGREAVALQSVVGYLADRIYFRTSLSGDPTLSEVVERVRHTVVEASSFKFVRSDIVLEELSRVHGPVSAPIFNMGPGARRALPSMGTASLEQRIEKFAISPPPVETGPSPGMCYWLTLTGAGQGWRGHVRYNGPVLPEFVSRYQHILQQMVTDRRARLSSVTLGR